MQKSSPSGEDPSEVEGEDTLEDRPAEAASSMSGPPGRAPSKRRRRRKKRRSERDEGAWIETLDPFRVFAHTGLCLLLLAMVLGPLAKGSATQRPGTFVPMWLLCWGAAVLVALAHRTAKPGPGPDRTSPDPGVPGTRTPPGPGMEGVAWGLLGAFLLWSAVSPAPDADPVLRMARVFSLSAAWAAGYAAYGLAVLIPWSMATVTLALVCLGLLESGIGALQGARLVARMGTWGGSEFPSGTFVNHNHFAGYLQLCLPMALAVTQDRARDRITRLLAGTTVFACLGGLGLAQSRAGWLAAGLGLLVWLARGIRPSLRWPGAAALAALAIVAAGSVAATAGGEVTRRLETMRAEDLGVTQSLRLAFWQSAISMIRAHPMTGVGAGNFENLHPAHRQPGAFMRPLYAHSDHLQVFAEAGIPAGIAFELAMALACYALWRRTMPSAETVERGYAAAGLAGLTSLLVHGLVDFNLQIPANMMTLAVLVAVSLAPRPPSKPKPTTGEDDPLKTDPPTGASWQGVPWRLAVLGGIGLAGAFLVGNRWTSADSLRDRSQVLLRQRLAIDAIDPAERAYSTMPRWGAALRNLASVLVEAANRSDGTIRKSYMHRALLALEELRVLDPWEVRDQLLVAQLLVALASEDPTGSLPSALVESESRLRHAVSYGPNDPLPRLALGEFLARLGRLEEGVPLLTQGLVELPPMERQPWVERFLQSGAPPALVERLIPASDSALAWTALARHLDRLGDAEGALRAWDKVRDQVPGDGEVRLERCLLLARLGKLGEALAEATNGKDFGASWTADVHEVVHRALRAAGDPDRSLRVLEAARAQFPSDPRWMILRGLHLVETGDSRQGLSDLAVATEGFPEDSRAPLELARLLARRGRDMADRQVLRDACSAYRTVLARDPLSVHASRELAQLYLELGEADRAQVLLERLVDGPGATLEDKVRLCRSLLERRLGGTALKILTGLAPEHGSTVVDGATVSQWRLRAAAAHAVELARLPRMGPEG